MWYAVCMLYICNACCCIAEEQVQHTCAPKKKAIIDPFRVLRSRKQRKPLDIIRPSGRTPSTTRLRKLTLITGGLNEERGEGTGKAK